MSSPMYKNKSFNNQHRRSSLFNLSAFDFNQQRPSTPTKNFTPSSLEFGLTQSVQWALTYPLECSNTLMKIGYEPIPPWPVRSLFSGTPALALPNVFLYVKHIAETDGLVGCYRGFVPYCLRQMTFGYTVHCMNSYYQPRINGCLRGKLSLSELRWTDDKPPPMSDIVLSTLWKMCTTSVGTIVSHPLYVVVVRMVAQFVGREARYKTVMGTFSAILNEHGISGFFRGLIPRLLAENCKILIPAAVFLGMTRLSNSRLAVSTTTALSRVLTDRYVHQFEVVAATMMIQNSSMIIGKAPFLAKKFTGWIECWTYLSNLNIENRGRSFFLRYYNGPTTEINGELKPLVYHGPYSRIPISKTH